MASAVARPAAADQRVKPDRSSNVLSLRSERSQRLWLQHRDPAAADRFYKALVRRCGRTALGRQADELRWFPKLEAEKK